MKKKVTILGAGESGTGAALLAQSRGYHVFVSDLGLVKEKYKSQLIAHAILFEEGRHSEEQILDSDLIIKSPGIPDKVDIIKKANSKGIRIIDEIEFAFRFVTGKVIAITGTNGKTTTSLLTYHLLKSAGLKVALVGNVGESMAGKLAKESFDWYVVEVSSFQLDGTRLFQPAIGILTNITPDHLDRYNYEMQNYVESKFKLVRNMTASQHFIFYGDDPVIAEELTKKNIEPLLVPISLKDRSQPVHYDGEAMTFSLGAEHFRILQKDTTLKGPHNLINTMCATAAAVLAGVPVEAVRSALKTFKNAPHRLESVGTINGIEFVNDSKATNVNSVYYALGSFDQSMVWVAGGIDKGNDYKLIQDQVKKKVKALICLGKDNSKLLKAFDHVVENISETQSIKELVQRALKLAKPGDIVLLSPACASFDLFRNYEDRGDQFREAVHELRQQVELGISMV